MEENWWSWFALVASILCISLLDGSMYSNGIFYKKIAEALNLSEFWVKLAGSIEVAISSFVAIAAAKLTDKYGPMYVAVGGAIIAATGWFWAIRATDYLELVGGQSLLAGTGFGLLYVPGVVAVGGIFLRNRSLALGLTLCGSGAGQVFFGPLDHNLLKEMVWESCFLFMMCLCLGCAIIAAGFLPNARPAIEVRTDEESE